MHYIVISILLINKRLKSIYILIRNLTENVSSPSGMSLTLKGRNRKKVKIYERNKTSARDKKSELVKSSSAR